MRDSLETQAQAAKATRHIKYVNRNTLQLTDDRKAQGGLPKFAFSAHEIKGTNKGRTRRKSPRNNPITDFLVAFAFVRAPELIVHFVLALNTLVSVLILNDSRYAIKHGCGQFAAFKTKQSNEFSESVRNSGANARPCIPQWPHMEFASRS